MKTENNPSLREQLLDLLDGEAAHVNFDAATRDLPPSLRGKRPQGGGHSPWELLEHLRIAQWDILEFVRNPKHVSPEFPAGYWPTQPDPPDDKAWDKSVAAFHADLKSMRGLVANESTDLLAPLPHANGKPLLQKALLVADHNAYHLGQLVLVRRLLGAWQ